MFADRFIIAFDNALRTLFVTPASLRPVPGDGLPETDFSEAEKRHVAGLMRVNHCGEICAQALYQGQAITSEEPRVRDALRAAAVEEGEHLAWAERRIGELGGRKSWLNPLWYAGSLSIGVLAGKFGDKWSLGFLVETERQVEAHLRDHQSRLPTHDRRTWEILEQMRIDEAGHGDTAARLGAAELPPPVRLAMRAAARVMTRTAYYV